ncbi:hypothetical protein [Flavobacterium sp. H4147]|uniref:hypothetical protein n=1 Tax=Flavobacterium sp. H4147 TaxID=3034149 RepID=UPI0023EDE4E2|nr:hypothetical protein [Flavobacterium sp. H4147]
MAKYVIHKISFFFTDESLIKLPEEEVKGSVVKIFNDLEEAKKEKQEMDLHSMQNLAGNSLSDFLDIDEDNSEILEKLQLFYKSEFNLNIDPNRYFEFPSVITEQQAKQFLDILHITFHNIVEYDDDEDPNDFEKFEDLLEF